MPLNLKSLEVINDFMQKIEENVYKKSSRAIKKSHCDMEFEVS